MNRGVSSSISGPGAAGGGGDPGESAREGFVNQMTALAGCEVVVMGGVSECTTDAAATLPAGKLDGVRTVENLAFGITGTSGQRFVETIATADTGRARLNDSEDFVVEDTSIRALELTTHPFTTGGEFLLGFVLWRHENVSTNSPIVALGNTPFTGQSFKFARRSGILGLTNDFNPPLNLGGAVDDYSDGWDYFTFARNNGNSTYRITLNGVEVYNGGQTINPSGTNRIPMLFGTEFGVGMQCHLRSVYIGTDITVQDDLAAILANVANL